MAITLDATVGGANANTYITLADANSFIEGLVLSDDTAAWDNSSTDNKNRALFTSASTSAINAAVSTGGFGLIGSSAINKKFTIIHNVSSTL